MSQAKHRPPSTDEVLARQRRDAERELVERQVASKPPARPEKPDPGEPGTAVTTKPATAVAAPDTRSEPERYIDEVAPASIVGRMIKFSKEGQFATHDDSEPIAEDTDFVALTDQTLIGWVKFYDDGAPPDRVMGLLYDGFRMPPRETLGDLDQSTWELGLSGLPADPWQHHIYLVLQRIDTSELFTFVTSSTTGRRAVGTLLRHFERMKRTHPDELPVVRLKVGGFRHRDERVGWVATPVFAVVGRSSRDSAAKPDTSIGADLNDSLPF